MKSFLGIFVVLATIVTLEASALLPKRVGHIQKQWETVQQNVPEWNHQGLPQGNGQIQKQWETGQQNVPEWNHQGLPQGNGQIQKQWETGQQNVPEWNHQGLPQGDGKIQKQRETVQQTVPEWNHQGLLQGNGQIQKQWETGQQNVPEWNHQGLPQGDGKIQKQWETVQKTVPEWNHQGLPQENGQIQKQWETGQQNVPEWNHQGLPQGDGQILKQWETLQQTVPKSNDLGLPQGDGQIQKQWETLQQTVPKSNHLGLTQGDGQIQKQWETGQQNVPEWNHQGLPQGDGQILKQWETLQQTVPKSNDLGLPQGDGLHQQTVPEWTPQGLPQRDGQIQQWETVQQTVPEWNHQGLPQGNGQIQKQWETVKQNVPEWNHQGLLQGDGQIQKQWETGQQNVPESNHQDLFQQPVQDWTSKNFYNSKQDDLTSYPTEHIFNQSSGRIIKNREYETVSSEKSYTPIQTDSQLSKLQRPSSKGKLTNNDAPKVDIIPFQIPGPDGIKILKVPTNSHQKLTLIRFRPPSPSVNSGDNVGDQLIQQGLTHNKPKSDDLSNIVNQRINRHRSPLEPSYLQGQNGDLNQQGTSYSQIEAYTYGNPQSYENLNGVPVQQATAQSQAIVTNTDVNQEQNNNEFYPQNKGIQYNPILQKEVKNNLTSPNEATTLNQEPNRQRSNLAPNYVQGYRNQNGDLTQQGFANSRAGSYVYRNPWYGDSSYIHGYPPQNYRIQYRGQPHIPAQQTISQSQNSVTNTDVNQLQSKNDFYTGSNYSQNNRNQDKILLQEEVTDNVTPSYDTTTVKEVFNKLGPLLAPNYLQGYENQNGDLTQQRIAYGNRRYYDQYYRDHLQNHVNQNRVPTQQAITQSQVNITSTVVNKEQYNKPNSIHSNNENQYAVPIQQSTAQSQTSVTNTDVSQGQNNNEFYPQNEGIQDSTLLQKEVKDNVTTLSKTTTVNQATNRHGSNLAPNYVQGYRNENGDLIQQEITDSQSDAYGNPKYGGRFYTDGNRPQNYGTQYEIPTQNQDQVTSTIVYQEKQNDEFYLVANNLQNNKNQDEATTQQVITQSQEQAIVENTIVNQELTNNGSYSNANYSNLSQNKGHVVKSITKTEVQASATHPTANQRKSYVVHTHSKKSDKSKDKIIGHVSQSDVTRTRHDRHPSYLWYKQQRHGSKNPLPNPSPSATKTTLQHFSHRGHSLPNLDYRKPPHTSINSPKIPTIWGIHGAPPSIHPHDSTTSSRDLLDAPSQDQSETTDASISSPTSFGNDNQVIASSEVNQYISNETLIKSSSQSDYASNENIYTSGLDESSISQQTTTPIYLTTDDETNDQADFQSSSGTISNPDYESNTSKVTQTKTSESSVNEHAKYKKSQIYIQNSPSYLSKPKISPPINTSSGDNTSNDYKDAPLNVPFDETQEVPFDDDNSSNGSPVTNQPKYIVDKTTIIDSTSKPQYLTSNQIRKARPNYLSDYRLLLQNSKQKDTSTPGYSYPGGDKNGDNAKNEDYKDSGIVNGDDKSLTYNKDTVQNTQYYQIDKIENVSVEYTTPSEFNSDTTSKSTKTTKTYHDTLTNEKPTDSTWNHYDDRENANDDDIKDSGLVTKQDKNVAYSKSFTQTKQDIDYSADSFEPNDTPADGSNLDANSEIIESKSKKSRVSQATVSKTDSVSKSKLPTDITSPLSGIDTVSQNCCTSDLLKLGLPEVPGTYGVFIKMITILEKLFGASALPLPLPLP